MPCSDNGQDEHENKLMYGLDISSADLAAAVACEVLHKAAEAGLIPQCSKTVQLWWKNHQARDEERRKTGWPLKHRNLP